jgi:hypothetical protein
VETSGFAESERYRRIIEQALINHFRPSEEQGLIDGALIRQRKGVLQVLCRGHSGVSISNTRSSPTCALIEQVHRIRAEQVLIGGTNTGHRTDPRPLQSMQGPERLGHTSRCRTISNRSKSDLWRALPGCSGPSIQRRCCVAQGITSNID